jgi:hypothetical protein
MTLEYTLTTIIYTISILTTNINDVIILVNNNFKTKNKNKNNKKITLKLNF